MKNSKDIAIIVVNMLMSFILFLVLFNNFKIITFNEMSRWFCVESNSIEYYRWFDQERTYRELLRKFPRDKKLKLEYWSIKQHLKQMSKEISNETQCSSPNHFYYKSQKIRDLSGVK